MIWLINYIPIFIRKRVSILILTRLCNVLNECNIKFTIYNDINEVTNELIELLRSKYQDNLETSMRGSDFIFHSVQLMHYKCHEVNFNVVVHILNLQTGQKIKNQQ